MPRRRFTERYNLPSSGGSGAASAMQMAEQQRRTMFGVRATAPDPLRDAAREAQISRSQASEAKANYQLQKQIETDRQQTAFYNGLQELESSLGTKYPIGTKEHAEAFAAYAHEFPLARSSKSVQDTLKVHSLIHDDQAALTQRMNTAIQAGKDLGLTPQGASFVKGGNVDVRFTQPGTNTEGSDPEAELFKSRALTKAQFLNPLNAKQGVVNDKGEFKTDFSPGQQANAIQFQAGSSKTDESKAVTHVMPLNEFNAYRQGLGQQPVPTFQYNPATSPNGQAAPSPAPDQTPIYTPSPSPESTPTSAIPTAHSKDEYDAIPPGAQFMSNGNLYVKPQPTPDTGE